MSMWVSSVPGPLLASAAARPSSVVTPEDPPSVTSAPHHVHAATPPFDDEYG